MEENKKNNEAKVDTDNNNNNSIETKTEPQENMVSTETAHTEKTVEIQQEEKKTSEADYEKLQKDYNDLKEILSRTVADTENFKKRKEKEVSELKKYAIENFVVELLPIIDNFRRAFASAENIDSIEKAKQIIDGFKIIEQELEKILIKNNVIEIKSINEIFNPNIHQAIQCVEVEDDEKDNKIIEEYQSAYKMYDKLIRTALVKVGKKTKKE